MTVNELAKRLNLNQIAVSDAERDVQGAYICDLLSWVIGRAKENDAWLTIMTNVNVVAVASLADVSCVILAEGVALDQDVISCAEDKGVNVLSSSLPMYELATKLNECLNE